MIMLEFMMVTDGEKGIEMVKGFSNLMTAFI